MIVGMGSDLVEIDRVASICERAETTFLRRVLSPRELEATRSMTEARKMEYVAGRFAAKEAIAKASGLGLGRLGMARVDITVGARGLQVTFLGDAAADPQLQGRWWVSISHTGQLAMAVAVLER